MEIKMPTTRWNRRRVIIFSICLVIVYWIFSASRNTYTSGVTIRNTKPEVAWEYVADFQKMRSLNPTILDFKITNDEGRFHDWKYSVVYTERLSHWPYWLNVADADFVVKKEFQNNRDVYTVSSQHRTCFVAGLYCLYSTGDFLFYAIGPDTYCSETVTYQCPPFLGPVCRREVNYQRKMIMRNLLIHFNKNQ